MNIESLAKGANDVLHQGLTVLAELDGPDFAKMAPEPYNASVGQHYRHVLDHFLCLKKRILSGEIDYDKRERDPRLETDIEFAKSSTTRLLVLLENSDIEVWGRQCTVRYSVGYSDAQPVPLPTTLARELAFCIGHAVHHYAIIRLLCGYLGARVIAELGVAPSTLQFRAAQLGR